MATILALLLVAGGAVAGYLFLLHETDEDRYLSAMATGGFTDSYATPELAVAAGHAFCASDVEEGVLEGYDYQEPAVIHLCPVRRPAFKLVATPQQQAVDLTSQLRSAGLGGLFPSDSAAVAHAESTCRALDDGGAMQGPEEDALAVAVYCPEYVDGFKTLQPIEVEGTFTLLDLDPSIYYTSISGGKKDCHGSNGYDDIGRATEVLITSGTGDLLTKTSLGKGTGLPPVMCEFTFDFEVMDGEQSGYIVSIGRRGEFRFTAAELKLPDAIDLSLGD